MIKYEYFIDNDSLFVVEKMRFIDQLQYSIIKLWLLEVCNSTLSVFCSMDQRLVNCLGEQKVVHDFQTSALGFVNHLKIKKGMKSLNNFQDNKVSMPSGLTNAYNHLMNRQPILSE